MKNNHDFVPDKVNCHICDHILEDLENIDDECDVYGIHMVKIQDPQLAKRYSIKTFPALVYFRYEKYLFLIALHFKILWSYLMILF